MSASTKIDEDESVDTKGTDDHESVSLDAGETLNSEDEDLSQEGAYDRLADGESVSMWEVDE